VEEPSSVTSLEYLVRRPLGAAALEASYYEGPEHVEEPGECDKVWNARVVVRVVGVCLCVVVVGVGGRVGG
jgi:hypothetical protein